MHSCSLPTHSAITRGTPTTSRTPTEWWPTDWHRRAAVPSANSCPSRHLSSGSTTSDCLAATSLRSDLGSTDQRADPHLGRHVSGLGPDLGAHAAGGPID